MLCLEGCFVGVKGEDPTWLWPLWRQKEEVAVGVHSWGLKGCPFTILDPCVCEGGLSSLHLSLSSDGVSSMEGRGEKRLLGGNWVSLKTASRTSRTAGVV